jgi:hypothetical protein
MERLRTLDLVLGIATITSAIPRHAAADTGIDGGQVLTWALVGAAVGGVIGLVAALSQPKAPSVAKPPGGPAARTALTLFPIAELQAAQTTDFGTSRLRDAFFAF